MYWYYTINRERFGPVSELTLKDLISTGKLSKDDLVWNTSMGDSWKTVGEEFAGLIEGKINHSESKGTGGQTPNAQITADARTALSGRWGIAIGGLFIYMIIIIAISIVSEIPFIGGLIELFLIPPMLVGLMSFSLTISREQDVEIGQLFSGFQRYWPAVATYFLAGLFMILWMLPGLLLLLIGVAFLPESQFSQYLPFSFPEGGAIPTAIAGGAILYLTAVIVGLRYSQIYYVLADDDSSGSLNAIRTSIMLMKGNKWKIVFLGLRFLGWALLSLLTLGIGFIWFYPYIMTAYARFYDDLKKHPSEVCRAELRENDSFDSCGY